MVPPSRSPPKTISGPWFSDATLPGICLPMRYHLPETSSTLRRPPVRRFEASLSFPGNALLRKTAMLSPLSPEPSPRRCGHQTERKTEIRRPTIQRLETPRCRDRQGGGRDEKGKDGGVRHSRTPTTVAKGTAVQGSTGFGGTTGRVPSSAVGSGGRHCGFGVGQPRPPEI